MDQVLVYGHQITPPVQVDLVEASFAGADCPEFGVPASSKELTLYRQQAVTTVK
jgi:hypothetical protein